MTTYQPSKSTYRTFPVAQKVLLCLFLANIYSARSVLQLHVHGFILCILFCVGLLLLKNMSVRFISNVYIIAGYL